MPENEKSPKNSGFFASAKAPQSYQPMPEANGFETL